MDGFRRFDCRTMTFDCDFSFVMFCCWYSFLFALQKCGKHISQETLISTSIFDTGMMRLLATLPAVGVNYKLIIALSS